MSSVCRSNAELQDSRLRTTAGSTKGAMRKAAMGVLMGGRVAGLGFVRCNEGEGPLRSDDPSLHQECMRATLRVF